MYENLWWYRIQTVIILTTGTLLLMWLGEQITERGIGNGISLVISIGIVAACRTPGNRCWTCSRRAARRGRAFQRVPWRRHAAADSGHCGVIAVTQAQRKVAVQYAQRAVGRKVVAGGTSFMPLRELRGRDADHFCASHPDVPAEDARYAEKSLKRVWLR